ncbi:caspase family protein [Mesorhizobium sp. WSM2561]|uniref:caspase family protein n=1 Tax=Mesorhizobium sp. WSM2561 TaxID=1040985 RepID=UPI0004B99442|nr:caspase family protein [Mesorhizobium sp. WSM2561]
MAGKLYGLLVGIDAYHSPVPSLNGCVNDIDEIAGVLNEIRKGSDCDVHLKLLKNAEATRSNIVEGFRSHLSKAGVGDTVLFYYSGHGSQEDSPPEFWHIEPDHLDETLVCYDSREEGHWDLADKELAGLIAEISRRDPHVLCVLDCCHSGSGTRAALESGAAVRRAPTDPRHRPIETFLEETLDAKRGPDDQTSGSGWAIVPSGKHVLLAACRADETAKEVVEAGKHQGAFTAALLAALRQTNGQITYRDLLKRAEAQVRLRVDQQVPQVECSDPDELQSLFLGRSAREQQGYFTLRYDREMRWVIDGGAIHGITPPANDEPTLLAVFDLDCGRKEKPRTDSALAFAEVREVRPELSQVELKLRGAVLSQQATYRAIVVATPLPAMGVHLKGSAIALQLVRQALAKANEGGTPSLLAREVTADDRASIRVDADENSIRISPALGESPLVAEIEGINEDGARIAVERLEHIARWDAIARLNNVGSRLSDGPVEIVVLVPDQVDTGKPVWKEADPQGGIHLEYRRIKDKWQQPQIRIELRNRSDVDLFCALLWLGEDYSVSSALFPGGVEHIPAGKSAAANAGKSIYASVPLAQWSSGRTEARDIVKLIVSSEQFDPRLFDQPPLDRYVRVGATKGFEQHPRNVLERLAKRVYSRALSTRPEGAELIVDWATSELALTVVRPLDATTVPQTGQRQTLGAGVTLVGHSALRAKMRLVSRGEAGRQLGGLSLPAIFRDDPDNSQPFYFQTPRGAEGGLGALELFDVENPEAVTASSPLLLQVDTTLGHNEHVLPFACDGEFFLPLGSARRAGDGVQIELRQLPSAVQTARDVQRGIVSSIRILFQKILSEKLGTGFDYPHLAAVSFSDEETPRYRTDVEGVRSRVAAAKRILLYVHGILGDTLGMATASQVPISLPNEHPHRIVDKYDLILAFDYENINTGIKETAAALKDRLAAVGLGPDHGKTLHIVAHSMGGLISRWFIECLDGRRVVQHLFTLGTPHAGSPWPNLQDWATAALAFGINRLTDIAWPLNLIGNLVEAAETADVMLDEMAPGSSIVAELAQTPDPLVPYTLLVGNTSMIKKAVADGRLERLLSKLSPQRVLHGATSLAFLRAPNDIAVSVVSAKAVPGNRATAHDISEIACDHITFFSSNAGREALIEALTRA